MLLVLHLPGQFWWLGSILWANRNHPWLNPGSLLNVPSSVDFALRYVTFWRWPIDLDNVSNSAVLRLRSVSPTRALLPFRRLDRDLAITLQLPGLFVRGVLVIGFTSRTRSGSRI